MISHGRRLLILGLPLALVAGCERVKSANPLSPLIAGPIAGVEITQPQLLQPEADSQIAVDRQPIRFVVENAVTNGVRPVSYVFQIAMDGTFANPIFTQTGVAAGGDGKTSLTMPQTLQPERTYFWRVQAQDGANQSNFSSPRPFKVYTPVIIESPLLRQPGDGSTVSTLRPTLVFANAVHSGPIVGDIHYIVEIATDPGMGNRVVGADIAENPGGQTTFAPSSDLAASTRHFWRVRAMDATTTGPFSPVASFMTPAPAPVPVPVPVPIPSPGGVANDQINVNQATFLNSPNMASWPITTSITEIELRSSGIRVEFSKKNGPGRWPDITPPGWDGALQYTLGMCLNIGNRWYCSAVVEYWHDLQESGGPPSQYAENWFYAPERWAPMTGHQPSVGETIGFYVCAGDCRNNPAGDLSPARERTNIVLVQMPTNGGALFRF